MTPIPNEVDVDVLVLGPTGLELVRNSGHSGSISAGGNENAGHIFPYALRTQGGIFLHRGGVATRSLSDWRDAALTFRWGLGDLHSETCATTTSSTSGGPSTEG
jgi:hypothetical protein